MEQFSHVEVHPCSQDAQMLHIFICKQIQTRLKTWQVGEEVHGNCVNPEEKGVLPPPMGNHLLKQNTKYKFQIKGSIAATNWEATKISPALS